MAQRRYPLDWQSRDEERRILRDEDRRYGRDADDDRDRDSCEMRYAHGRYSGTEQGEDRRRLEGERPFGARYHRGEGSFGGGMERIGGYGEGYRGDEHHQRGTMPRESPSPMGYDATDPARSMGVCNDARIDEQRRYRGIGPKGYTRADERIREDVCDRLTEVATLDASAIDVSVMGGDVTLRGSVTSRADKRHVEDSVETVPGVRNVQNNLRVGDNGSQGH